ncbi:MAG: cytochrome c [Acidobacteriota bacterium]|nr:cytochrome c [Acidobacteriota bacterium]
MKVTPLNLGAGMVLVVAIAAGANQRASVWDGVYTAAQAQRGAPLYEKDCAECHGADLSGGEMAPGLVGDEFVWTWNGLSVGELFERLRVSMPQGLPGRVSRQAKADILAFMLAMNGFPPGGTELVSRTERLARIDFLVEQP